MTHDQLIAELKKGQIRPYYYLYGEEAYLIQEAIDLIQQKVLGDKVSVGSGNDFNWDLYYADEVPIDRIIDAAQTLPLGFFGKGKRLVVVKRAEKLSGQQLEDIISYLCNPNPSTCLVFCALKADTKRKFFKIFQEKGALVKHTKPYENQLPRYLNEQLEKLGKQMTPNAARVFLDFSSSNLHQMHNNLLKIIDFVGDREKIEIGDIEKILSDQKNKTVFDLSNAVASGNPKEAIKSLSKLLDEGQVPIVIFTMLVRHYRNLFMAREMLDDGYGPSQISEEIGVPRFFIKDLIGQARRHKLVGLRQINSLFAFYDRCLKYSKVPKELVLERLVLELSTGGETVTSR